MSKTTKVAVMSLLVAALLLAMVVSIASADTGSQTWYLCTDTSLNKAAPASGSIDIEVESMAMGTKSFLAEPTQCNLTMGAGTWTAYIEFNAADAGTIELQVLKKLNGMSKTIANTRDISLSAGHHNITQDIVSSASEEFEAGQKLEFKIFWHPSDMASKLTVYCGEGKSNFSSPTPDTTPPVITNIIATEITDKSAKIVWDTNEIADSLVKYGTTSGIYTKGEDNPEFVNNHSIKLTEMLPGTCYYFVVISIDLSGNLAESLEKSFNTSDGPTPTPTPQRAVFDTDTPSNPYPSISGTHSGTIKPTVVVEVSKLYTYPCPGTGGHTEYAEIWNGSADWNVTARWDGYKDDWYNISFDDNFTLEAGETYSYTIKTGSYPQILHTANLSTPTGVITCSEFEDVNGNKYTDVIPAIMLWE